MSVQKVIRLSIILPQLDGLSGTLHLESWTPETTDIIWDRAEDVAVPEDTQTEETETEQTEAEQAEPDQPAEQ